MTSRTLNLTSSSGIFDAFLRQADLIGWAAEAIYALCVRRVLRAIQRSV